VWRCAVGWCPWRVAVPLRPPLCGAALFFVRVNQVLVRLWARTQFPVLRCWLSEMSDCTAGVGDGSLSGCMSDRVAGAWVDPCMRCPSGWAASVQRRCERSCWIGMAVWLRLHPGALASGCVCDEAACGFERDPVCANLRSGAVADWVAGLIVGGCLTTDDGEPAPASEDGFRA
jgi:hypothetical protein